MMSDINHCDSSIFAAAPAHPQLLPPAAIRLVSLPGTAGAHLLFAARQILAQLQRRTLTPPVRLGHLLAAHRLARLTGGQTSLQSLAVIDFRLVRTHLFVIAENPARQKTDTFFPTIFHRS